MQPELQSTNAARETGQYEVVDIFCNLTPNERIVASFFPNGARRDGALRIYNSLRSGGASHDDSLTQVISTNASQQIARDSKIRLYKTAKATLACAHFGAGEYVSVQYSNTTNGVNWFLIHKTEKKTLENPVAYPQHHLTSFCL